MRAERAVARALARDGEVLVSYVARQETAGFGKLACASSKVCDLCVVWIPVARSFKEFANGGFFENASCDFQVENFNLEDSFRIVRDINDH